MQTGWELVFTTQTDDQTGLGLIDVWMKSDPKRGSSQCPSTPGSVRPDDGDRLRPAAGGPVSSLLSEAAS